MIRNDRKFIWGLTGSFLGDNLAFLFVGILERCYGFSISLDIVGRISLISICLFGVIGFIAGIFYTKRFNFLKECYEADFDKCSIRRLYVIETAIILTLNLISIIGGAVMLELEWC